MFDLTFTERDLNVIFTMGVFTLAVISFVSFLGYQERKARRGK